MQMASGVGTQVVFDCVSQPFDECEKQLSKI